MKRAGITHCTCCPVYLKQQYADKKPQYVAGKRSKEGGSERHRNTANGARTGDQVSVSVCGGHNSSENKAMSLEFRQYV
jgi:hypothetical protein